MASLELEIKPLLASYVSLYSPTIKLNLIQPFFISISSIRFALSLLFTLNYATNLLLIIFTALTTILSTSKEI